MIKINDTQMLKIYRTNISFLNFKCANILNGTQNCLAKCIQQLVLSFIESSAIALSGDDCLVILTLSCTLDVEE